VPPPFLVSSYPRQWKALPDPFAAWLITASTRQQASSTATTTYMTRIQPLVYHHPLLSLYIGACSLPPFSPCTKTRKAWTRKQRTPGCSHCCC
jgi:hypothetical protein